MLGFSAFIPIYFTATSAISLLTALLIMVSGVKQHRSEYYAMSLLCIVFTAYQVFTWNYHTASNLTEAVSWLKWQTTALIIAAPVYFYSFAAWAKQEKRHFWSALLVIVAIILLFINVTSDFTIRFSSATELRTFEIWTGETAAVVEGERSLASRFYHAFAFVVLCGLITLIKPLFVLGERSVSLVLSATIFAQVLVAILAIMIDAGQVNFVYVTAIPIIFLNVSICVLGASHLRIQDQRYQRLHRKTSILENSISELAKGNNFGSSKEFYQHTLSTLHNLTGSEYVFIGLIENAGDQPTIKTETVLKNGEVIENFSYALVDTPCEKVFEEGTCVYPQSVAELFPKDFMLVDMQIESYLGTPLLGETGELIGLLTLLDTKPFKARKQIIETIEIFASRAAAEIRRDQVEAKLHQLAYVDHTTGLSNKARTFEVIEETLFNRKLDGDNALLMLIDVDSFSSINHNYGYHVGEQVLKELGQRLSDYQHDDIFIARNGGDEFAAVFPNAGQHPISSMNIHWEALRAVLRRPIVTETQIIQLEFNMGAVIFPEQIGGSFDAMQCAETALLESKRARKGGAYLFEPELLQVRERYKFIDTQLRAALKEEQQLRVVYQPKTLATGEMIGIEALLRWRHPVQGEISPGEFIAIAERSALIIELGTWVIAEVCQQIATWKEQGFESKVAINIASAQLLNADFIDIITGQIQKYKIAPELIEVEITESGLLNDVDRAAGVLNTLRLMGISVALDDFGTGYSSLSYLRELPLDVLKIDKSFIDKISDQSSSELIRTIITIGQQLNLSIIAEGTESAEQVTSLLAMGCHHFQGYYFSRPMEAADVPNWHFAK